ncbi:MAG: glycosyltransferase [Gemmatimonadota bacterium]
MTRAARDGRVFVFEEPIEGDRPGLQITHPQQNITVATPCLPRGLTSEERDEAQRELLDGWLTRAGVRGREFVLWFYTPMALRFAAHLDPAATVYDCMDELSGFAGAPAELPRLERRLFDRADVVFTGGHSLHEAKQRMHPHVYAVPSSVDVRHFAQAFDCRHNPADQASIPRPRLGYSGVIDERLDLDLIAGVAAAHPEWHLTFVGPVTKIDPSSLPQAPNIHYLGPREYDELPCYLAGWDVALLPFAHNEATRYISPTKTPEYLAAGRRVVSTSIRDVVRTFGESGLVWFGDDVQSFSEAIGRALERTDSTHVARAAGFLSRTSWDRTWSLMQSLMARALSQPAGDERTVARRRTRLVIAPASRYALEEPGVGRIELGVVRS